MNINFHAKNITLNPEHEEYIRHKLEHLTRLSAHLQDDSVQCDVHIEKGHDKSHGSHVEMKVSISVPNNLLYAEVFDSLQVTEAIDLLVDKLKHQIEKYKTKQ
ncbi:MAG: hypothetical protein UR28_C0012G0005 [Candidatus Peregrinibacteria bacterium GW2011_GWF2_33_10]|nr:MAG: hypothetical protein UR28_C0012G0005 [Candidatus Peregrinibacteria bacterium GW2011_GWF2_33_10]OGJ44089.1 MAG: ribosomal subunit interface protein [Candidatus Peregrinibacteria bacterium RIFOXYA2_FULL_33_21]OGJ45735.1 MAG: ribosomal subunit interface protein [Candidatus Peregrinibacteria bacterium RIFOXYA12_FULL_33_12]OGJ51386.1 MAG: ribosomal subunit interface protein [Candidatus Peregrinibacteria bacterium RIFOXYB2_FULL_33_20]